MANRHRVMATLLRATKIMAVVVSIAGLSQAVAALAEATPARVILIRHAEKNGDGDKELNEKGWERARALVALFTKDARMTTFGSPIAIFAAAPKHLGGAVRTVQTVTPLAESLGLDINLDYTKKQTDELASNVLSDPSYDGKTVVICWHHGTIVELARAFGSYDSPDSWDKEVYDRAWVMDFAAEQGPQFRDLPQHLLAGDSQD